MSTQLRVLFVEDSDNDVELCVSHLRRSGFEIEHLRVETAEAMRAALQQHTWDVVLSDYSMPRFSGPGALAVLRDSSQDVPFIILSGTIGEETAVAALKAGAHDFLSKNSLARLVPAIEREVREVQVRRERRLADEARHASELQYRRIVETAQEGICVVDSESRITYLNARIAEMLREPPDRLLGTSLLDVIDPEWNALATRAGTEPKKRTIEQHELKFTRRDESEFWGLVSTNRIADADGGDREGALLMVTDVTERRELQAHLMVADRMASIGTLAAGVAHEINNPLTTVVMNLELAVADLGAIVEKYPRSAADGERIREKLRDACDAAERACGIVRDLKVFSRVESDSLAAVDVHHVLNSSIRMAWNEVRHRARLIRDYGQIPPVEANDFRLGQLFLNLIINAAQSIPEGASETNEIRISTRAASDGWVLVEVRDTGCGMPPRVLRQLFTPFFTTKPIGVGTGLGLSICQRIVAAIGGSITVESTLGKGSVFRLRLPPAHTPVVVAESARPAVGEVHRGRVLLVDDENMILTTLQRTLGRDHDVETTSRARDALARVISGDRFDVILCDMMMPDMTGMDLHAELLRVAPEQAARMIFLTGGAFTARARAFLEEGKNLCIEKPFNAAALRAVVSERVGATVSDTRM